MHKTRRSTSLNNPNTDRCRRGVLYGARGHAKTPVNEFQPPLYLSANNSTNPNTNTNSNFSSTAIRS
eukprot:1392335-Amorphochlora_amoeboformis.AAC.1